MRNLFQDNPDRWDIAAPAALTSGQGVLVGTQFGVAMHAADNGAPVTLKTEGIVDLPKQAGAGVTFALGARVFWDQANTRCAASAPGLTLIGIAAAAAANADATVRVRLVPSAAAPV